LIVAETGAIRTPDQRLRVFVSSALQELAAERRAVRDAIASLRLVPVMFEQGARPHPPRQVYRAYLAQSQVFIGVYWQSYGWVAPGEHVSGLEDEYRLSAGLPRLLYVKSPAPDRDPRLEQMLAGIRDADEVSYQHFSGPDELRVLVENDLAVLLSERFEIAGARDGPTGEAPLTGVLPVPPTPLVGRDQEVTALCDLVLGEGVRLVTLTGPGGVGKTRLAIEVADRLRPGFPDGARFVDLASVHDADVVPAAVAAGLGLSTSGAQLQTDVEAYLRPRRLVLLLDNFEQVAEAAPLVARLLSTAPGLVALVTSRAVLRLSGEHEFAVAPLAVPPAGARDVGQYDSVRLFAERAHAAAAGFELTGENAEAVAQICRRLDGLPLAIELAAARVLLLPPAALLARLNDWMGLLTTGARDLPQRQRTLRSTLDWSFDLLTVAQQNLFTRLGVFAGTFGLSAAEAVCRPGLGGARADPDGDVMDTLGSLVDSSLVRPETRGGEPRFGLLGIIRDYARERLREGAGWQDAHDRHATYFLAFAEPTAADLQGPGQLAWLDRMETEHDNLRAALSWLVDSDQVERAVDLFWVTWRFWWLRGHASELTRLAEKIVAGSGSLPPYQRALALTGTGFIFAANDQNARAETVFEQSLRWFGQTHEELGTGLTATVLNVLGRLAGLRRDYAVAGELLTRSQSVLAEVSEDKLTGYERLQHRLTIALGDNFSGQIRLSQEDYDGAARLFADGLAVARRAPDWISTLISHYDLALSSQGQGDLAAATQHLKDGLSLADEAGDETSVAYYLEGLATVAGQQDNPERAVRLLAAAGALRQAKGSGWLHAYVPRFPHDEAVMAALRSRLGDEAFEEAWAQGAAVAGRRAVELGLEESDPAGPAPDARSAGRRRR
jgi:predicted ATPase